MLMCDFQHKLRKLNPRLYVNTDKVNRICDDVFVTGIYYKDSHASTNLKEFELAYAGEAKTYLADIDSGHLDKFICGCPVNYVPEHDIKKDGRLVVRGYRSILKILLDSKLIDKHKAESLFGIHLTR